MGFSPSAFPTGMKTSRLENSMSSSWGKVSEGESDGRVSWRCHRNRVMDTEKETCTNKIAREGDSCQMGYSSTPSGLLCLSGDQPLQGCADQHFAAARDLGAHEGWFCFAAVNIYVCILEPVVSRAILTGWGHCSCPAGGGATLHPQPDLSGRNLPWCRAPCCAWCAK